MRAATYARYSSDLQRPASIEDQVRRYREAVAHRGWSDAHVFEDSEIPGMVSAGRPGYQRMLRAARTHEFDVLVVDELSRLTRRPSELFSLYERLQFWGIGLVSLLEGLDSVAAPEAAKAIIALRSYTNEAEGQANAHRSRRGLEGRVLAGYHAGGAPYGYRTRAMHADKPGDPAGTGPVIGYEYLIHEAEAEVIRRVFQMYTDGMSTRQIAAALNAEGIVPPGARWRDREGVRRTWSHGAIHGDRKKGLGLLNQEKYVGRLVWNRSTWPRDPEQDGKQVRRELSEDKWVTRDVPELRIVPQDLWETVKMRQRQCSRAGSRSNAHWRNRRLLSGLLVCAKCGGRFVLHGANTYTCSTRQNRGAVVCDCMVTVNAAAAEQAVLDELEALFCTDGFIEKLIQRVQQRWREGQSSRARQRSSVKTLRQKLSEAQAEIQRLVTAITKGKLVDELEAQMAAAEARRNRLRQELAAAEGAELPATLNVLPATIGRIVGNLPGMLAAGQLEPVKSALTRLVGKIEVQGEEIPGRKRPGAVLVLRGNLEAALQLAGEKVKGVYSPGGIRTLVTIETPARQYRLQGRWYRPGSDGPYLRQTAYGV